MEKQKDEKGNPLTFWGGIKNNDKNEEQLLNPFKWNMSSRFLAVLFWLLSSVLSIAVINE